MWAQIALAAAPYVIAAMQDKPKAPSAPALRNPVNRDAQVNDLLGSAYDPNNAVWQRASAMASEQVNRALAHQGLAGSSIGGQLHSMTQSDLAAKWLQDQVQRKSQALNAVSGYDNGQVGGYNSNANAAYNFEMDAYNRAMGANAAQVQNISGLASAGLQAYNQQQIMDRYKQMNQPQVYQGTPQMLNYGVPQQNYTLGGGNWALPTNPDFGGQ